MDDFTSREAPLEYWFWKFHAGDLAFLVDFILRRSIGQAEVRVSLWVRGHGRVEHAVSGSWHAAGSDVSIDGRELHSRGSRGALADISWDLRWEPGPDRVDPRPRVFGPMHPLDMELLLRPTGRVTGAVTVASETFAVSDAPVVLTHYWGRRLPDRWCWISATEFGHDPDRRLELLIATSGVWGRGRLPFPVGYLWTTDSQGPELTVFPLSGLIRQRRVGDTVMIGALRIDGRRLRVICGAPATAFNDLGEGIRQTLMADLVYDGQRAVPGRVGLEFRDAQRTNQTDSAPEPCNR